MENQLCDPRLSGLKAGTAEWFAAQRDAIRSKPLIAKCYDGWYTIMLEDAATVPVQPPKALWVELGSGSSYLKELRPDVITSDVSTGIADRVIDARHLPFEEDSVGALFLTHVLHHIPDVSQFFREARRVLIPGGVISMVEVSHTPFGRWFFSHFHDEPYDDRSEGWEFQQRDSMADSNQALSWIVFKRDRERFQAEFPELRMEATSYLPWLSYLLSGGVKFRSLVPGFLTGPVTLMDALLRPLDPVFALHWHLRVRKVVGRS